ncbi:hypothetical protein AB0H36_08640 [Kribbella sp. NPDC050820]|uniref:hypothetical protein n=1 Tax=Kribbella sp. NPDC050820 TaxID=3155408 RepID=UPI0033F6AFAA
MATIRMSLSSSCWWMPFVPGPLVAAHAGLDVQVGQPDPVDVDLLLLKRVDHHICQLVGVRLTR